MDISDDQRDNFLALYAAARRGDADALASLVDEIGDIDTRFTNGYTPLMWAARVGHTVAASLLIGNQPGAKVDAVNEFCATALCEAVDNGNTEVAKLLVTSGANPNAQDIRGNTPMMLAARGGHVEAMRSLLEAGPDLEVQNGQGQTALMWAVVGGTVKAVRLLLEKGASAATVDDDEVGALQLA